MQGKKLISILSLIALLASIVAIYFVIQNSKLKSSNNELLQESTNVEQINQYQMKLASIDSLAMNGNYSMALNDYVNLEKDTSLAKYFDLRIRIKLTKKLAQLPTANNVNIKERNYQGMDITGSIQQKGGIISPNLTLKEAQQEIKNLKAQLSSSNTNDYLTFKTTKGTNLHYLGGVKNNKANGYGIALFETGSRYEGQWKDNNRHGNGKFYWDDGQIYEGAYRNDRREGHGIYYWENGEKYVGEWKEDQRNGVGKFYNKRGKLKASGIWKDDKLVEEN